MERGVCGAACCWRLEDAALIPDHVVRSSHEGGQRSERRIDMNTTQSPKDKQPAGYFSRAGNISCVMVVKATALLFRHIRSAIPGVLAAAAAAALSCAVFVPGLSVMPAYAQTEAAPTVNTDAKIEVKQPDATTVPKTSWPLLPHETLNVPLPEKPGCFHLVDGSWQEVPCMTEEETKRLPPPTVADTIQSTSHKYNGKTVTTPLQWGAVAIQLTDPQNAIETELCNQATARSTDNWSIQANTNHFACSSCTNTCSSCSNGFPFPYSQPGDNGWVQFGYQQWGVDSGGPLCVWNVELQCQCRQKDSNGNCIGAAYKSYCVSPFGTAPVSPLTGPGSSAEVYEVAGYVQCGYPPNTQNVGPNGCTLWVLGYLPNLPTPGWWAASAPDNLGLGPGNWNSIGGSLYGSDNGCVAVFTPVLNTTVVNTTVVANSCFQSPQPPNNTVPIFTPGCDYKAKYDLSGTIAFVYGNGTNESNNLKSGDASLSCSDFECRMRWGGTSDESAPGIAVRTANPAGEADVVMWGPNNSLKYYHATPGSKWASDTVAGSGTTYSAPAIAVRPTGEADVVAMGPNNSLKYYHALPGKPWSVNTIAGSGTTYSAPAIVVRSTGEADVVAQGPSQSLMYYNAMPGKPWSSETIPGSVGLVYSTPAIGVNSTTGRADIVWMGPYHELLDTNATPGSPWDVINVAGENSTFYPPAIAVRSNGEIDVVTTAYNGSLNYYYLLPGDIYWSSSQIPVGMVTLYPPAMQCVRTVRRMLWRSRPMSWITSGRLPAPVGAKPR